MGRRKTTDIPQKTAIRNPLKRVLPLLFRRLPLDRESENEVPHFAPPEKTAFRIGANFTMTGGNSLHGVRYAPL
jgi:hypothetical protein